MFVDIDILNIKLKTIIVFKVISKTCLRKIRLIYFYMCVTNVRKKFYLLKEINNKIRYK